MSAETLREPISSGAEWTFELLQQYDEEIRDIAVNEFGLDCYPNQIEVIASEQMLDAYASLGLPISYPHWSYGKEFIKNEQSYRKGMSGLAYEIVINSNPCISYNMEDNSMALQTLVMAHAAFGHNHFFKNNYLFRQWTDADGILDYFQYAKSFVSRCEERHGLAAVEAVLDAAHALMDQGVFRYRRPPPPTKRAIEERRRALAEYEERSFNDLWRTLPESARKAEPDKSEKARLERKNRR